MVTQQQSFDRAFTIDKNIPSSVSATVGPLIGWAAFNVGMARTGVGLVDNLVTQEGWADLRQVLGLDSHSTTEAGALSLTAAAVTTSIDLSAAAALRLAGAALSNDFEFSMSSFDSRSYRDVKDQLKAHPLSPALMMWKDKTRASQEWHLLKDCRNKLVHRAIPKRVNLSNTPDIPASEVMIHGSDYPIDVLVRRFTTFGETTFDRFCDAVVLDFP